MVCCLKAAAPQGHREFTVVGKYTSLIWSHKSWKNGHLAPPSELPKKIDSEKANIKKITIKLSEHRPPSIPSSPIYTLSLGKSSVWKRYGLKRDKIAGWPITNDKVNTLLINHHAFHNTTVRIAAEGICAFIIKKAKAIPPPLQAIWV